jgi:phosphomannomutase/phosphoglucomutase
MDIVGVPSHVYRGYDIRGLVDTDLNENVYYTLGKAYATFLYRRQINECVVGRDIRITSESYAKSFTQGLLEMGINVIDFGLSLTQIMYFSQYHYLSKGGAMITASHNPKEFNGLKLAVGFSDTMVGNEIQEVRAIAETKDFKGWDKKVSTKKKMYFLRINQTYLNVCLFMIQA